MDICLICGKEYDPMLEPHHEDICEDELADKIILKVKTDPALMEVLERLINGKKN